MDDLISEFLTETLENLSVIDLQLVKFEQNPKDEEILGGIFRLVHTIKGTCGFLGLQRLESVAHAGENVLGKFRDKQLEVTPSAVTLILKCIDCLRGLLSDLEQNGAELEGDDSEIIAELNAMAEGRTGGEAAAPADEPAPAEEPQAAAAPEAAEGDAPVISEEGFPVAQELLDELATMGISAADLAASDAPAPQAAPAAPAPVAVAPPPAAVAPPPAPAAKAPAAASKAAAVPAKKPAPAKAAESSKETKEPSVANQSIRVNVHLLENLMTLVSEMVLTRNHLLQMTRGREESEFKTAVQHLNRITTDLQEGVMKTRMQPIGNAWASLPRIVRDLAVETGKKIDLEMSGSEVELDRQLLEMIKDPLTHMVRNSADHGLEPPEDRLAAGKPVTGVIKLRAFHEGGHIIIEIADDGRGLNTERVKKKIIQLGLHTEAEVEAMDERQIHQFILKPSFSTAEKVTSVSGRGVGMDVVKTNIEQIGGTLEFRSVQGKGTTFTIKIPLTLAIISALVVECSHERFAMPQISVLELVRVSDHSDAAIETINDSPVLRLRNRLLPLVSLRDLLKLGDGQPNRGGEDGEDGDNAPVAKSVLTGSDNEYFIVVTQVGSHSFGIIVDRVFDTEEIVVKPVAPIIRHIPFYSGNTILGDGSVIMILDPNGIATATNQGAAPEIVPAPVADPSGSEQKSSLLIFRAGGKELKAVPLALVARLEVIERASIEIGSGKHLVQYRGQLMPLVAMNEDHVWGSEGKQPILVFTDRNRATGLVVDEIVDIVEASLNIEIASTQKGILGSAIIAEKATDVIDAGYYLTQAFPDWFGAREGGGTETNATQNQVLLVDDSQFFRSLLAPYLSANGFRVTTAESAEKALALRESGKMFDAIVSDIEMPGMNGFEFIESVRADTLWASIPCIALSSHAGHEYIARSAQAGFNGYVEKVKRNDLIRELKRVLSGSDESSTMGEAA